MDHPATVDEPRAERRPKFRRPLTERERDVLRYLPTRLSTVDIAQGLQISPNTVKTHLKNIYEKLGAGSRNEAIIKAARLHLISDESAALVRPLSDDAAGLIVP
jgi:LuxR family maltose regulon positive regulatory protein